MTEPKKKEFDRKEWDFTQVPAREEVECCYFEYARESRYIIEQLDGPAPRIVDSQRALLQKSILNHSLPPRREPYFDTPWLAKNTEWRSWFCKWFAKHWDGLSYLRSYGATPDHAFFVGVSPHFPWHQHKKDFTKRTFDPDTGLEVLRVTIDWGNFDDTQIIGQFKKWVKSEEGRPRGIGLRDKKGNRKHIWGARLQRLALLRLRHHYSLDEIALMLPDAWKDKVKFTDAKDAEKERKAALSTLLELYPFLPKNTRPVSWRRA